MNFIQTRRWPIRYAMIINVFIFFTAVQMAYAQRLQIEEVRIDGILEQDFGLATASILVRNNTMDMIDLNPLFVLGSFITGPQPIPSLGIACGSLVLEPGDSVVLSGAAVPLSNGSVSIAINDRPVSNVLGDRLCYVGWGVFQGFDPDLEDAISEGIWEDTVLVNNLTENSVIVYDGDGISASDWSFATSSTSCPAPPFPLVLMDEIGMIDNDNYFVEILNISQDTLDMSSWIIYSQGASIAASELNTPCGDLSQVAPLQTVVLSNITFLDETDDEVAVFYADNFTDPTAMAGYVEWGPSAHPTSDIARQADFWRMSDQALAGFALGGSIKRFANRGQLTTEWTQRDNYFICSQINSPVVIREVGAYWLEPGSTPPAIPGAFSLLNISDSTVDVSDWWISTDPGGSAALSSLDLYCGSLILEPGDSVALQSNMDFIDARANRITLATSSDFNNVNDLRSFVAYGVLNALNRPSGLLAAEAGLWVEGDVGLGSLLGNASHINVGFTNSAESWITDVTSNICFGENVDCDQYTLAPATIRFANNGLDTFRYCALDGIPDFINVEIEDPGLGDDFGILAIFPNEFFPRVDGGFTIEELNNFLDTTDIDTEQGYYDFVGVNSGEIYGFVPGMSFLDDYQGCFELSNRLVSIGVIIPTRGTPIAYAGGGTEQRICVEDGEDDFVDVIFDGAPPLGEDLRWVITEADSTILAITDDISSVNFEGSDPGLCLIWHIASSDKVDHLEVGQNITRASGCAYLSNPIELYRASASESECMSSTFLPEGDNDELIAYPNPTDDVLYVELKNDDRSISNWQLVDLQGRVVRRANTSSDNGSTVLTIPVNDLSAAAYYLHAYTDQAAYRKMIVIGK